MRLERVARAVAVELWPTLEAELRRQRTELEHLLVHLRATGTHALSATHFGESHKLLCGESRSLGWCLAALASACGADLLGVRSEPEGLRWMLAAVLRARGQCVEPTLEALPRIRVDPAQGVELCVMAAYQALRTSAREALRWTLVRDGVERRLSFVGTGAATNAALAVDPLEVEGDGTVACTGAAERLELCWREAARAGAG